MADFLNSLLMVNPSERLCSYEALRHPWLNTVPYAYGTEREFNSKTTKRDQEEFE